MKAWLGSRSSFDFTVCLVVVRNNIQTSEIFTYSPWLENGSSVKLLCMCRNIVCTVNLGCKLDLKKIALHARNAEYNPKRFAAVIMRIRDPRTTALIFSSGKMVCTGAKRFIHSLYLCYNAVICCWTVAFLCRMLHVHRVHEKTVPLYTLP